MCCETLVYSLKGQSGVDLEETSGRADQEAITECLVVTAIRFRAGSFLVWLFTSERAKNNHSMLRGTEECQRWCTACVLSLAARYAYKSLVSRSDRATGAHTCDRLRINKVTLTTRASVRVVQPQ